MKKKVTSSFAIITIAIAALIGYVLVTNKTEGPEHFTDVAVDQRAKIVNVEGVLEQNNVNTDTLEQVAVSPQDKIMKATFNTNKGSFELELFPELAPKTVENFVTLAESEFYNGVKFHRVIKGFMIQAGDPQSKDDDLSDRWGTGGPGYTFEDEIHAKNNNLIGTISMANAGPNTNGSQFFINTNDNDFLDTKHTVFGKVVSGLDIVSTIEGVETFPGDRPVEPVVIESIVIAK